MSKKAQTDSLTLIEGMILAIFLILVVFTACTNIFKTQADVRSRINFDQISSYLQQCQQLGEKDCFCPLLQLESMAPDISLQLQTLSDGLYLDLRETGATIPLERKKVSDKKFCVQDYSLRDRRWNSQITNSYSFTSKQRFYGYIDSAGNLCSLTSIYAPDFLTQQITSDFKLCSAPTTSLRLYIHHRHPQNALDDKEALLLAHRYLDTLQSTLASLGRLSFTKLQPTTKTISKTSERPDYSFLFDPSSTRFFEIAKGVQQPYATNFILLSFLFGQQASAAPEDTLTLSYLTPSSSSKSLALALQQSLQALSDKSYTQQQLLPKEHPSFANHLLHFTVRLEPLTDEQIISKNLLFSESWFQKNHPTLYSQRAELPAVFVDFIDFQNSYSLYQDHESTFSEAFLRGIQAYLQQPAPKTQDVFQP